MAVWPTVGQTARHCGSAAGATKGMQHVDDAEKENIGKVAGLGGGLLAGAKVGAVVVPIPLVGPFAGAVLGGLLGSEIGKTAGKAVINGATAFVETFRAPAVEPVEAD